MKNRKYIIRLLTLMLAFALVFTSLGISAFAASDDSSSDEDIAVTISEDDEDEDTDPDVSSPRQVKVEAVKQRLADGENQRTKFLDTDNKITITWKKPSKGKVAKYEIWCGNGEFIKRVSADKTKLTFDAPVGKHAYIVRAYDSDGNYSWTKSKRIRGKALDEIHREWTWTATMDHKTPLFKNKGGGAKIKNLAKGTKGIIIGTHPKRPKKWNKPVRVYIQLLDKKGNLTDTKGWVKYGAISAGPNIDIHHDYTREAKEEFANRFRSNTNYLIWVNGYTQRINIFKGKKGSWKLVSSNRVTLGNYYQPVSTGTNKKLKSQKGTVWMMDDKGRSYYFNYARTFGGSGYFHTRSYWANGHAKNKVQYRPSTKGCIRQYTDDAKYVYRLPKMTRILFL